MGKSDKKRKATEATIEETNPTKEGSVKKKSKSKETTNEIVMKDGELPETTTLDSSLLDALSPIAHPLADKKLGKRVLRTVKKGRFNHNHLVSYNDLYIFRLVSLDWKHRF